jgi:hypothetical protein
VGIPPISYNYILIHIVDRCSTEHSILALGNNIKIEKIKIPRDIVDDCGT